MDALMVQFLFWGSIIGFFLFILVGVFIWTYTKGFNKKLMIIEKRGDGITYWRFLKAKLIMKDGVARYFPLTLAIFNKHKLEIRPSDHPKHVYRFEGQDMIILAKDTKGDYNYVEFNYEGNSFSIIPQEVHLWATTIKREQELIHKQGVNWSVIVAYGVVALGMIICLIMVIFTLDWASKIQATCSTAQVAVNASASQGQIPVVGNLINGAMK